MSCGVGHRRGSDPALLWLWYRLAATAPIRPLAWESPYASGAGLEKPKRQKDNKEEWGEFCHRDPGISHCQGDASANRIFFLSFCLFAISRAAPAAYGDSQARGLIGAVATGLRQSHSNSESQPRLQPTPQLTATPDR